MKSHLELPLFPLPNVVHFPHTVLRLHIFEPRYRRLVKDLAVKEAGERLIGMLLLCEQQDGEPVVAGAGTAGRVVAVEPLADGRFDIELYGAFRFRVEREIAARPYRCAIVQPWDEPPFDSRSAELAALHSHLQGLVREVALESGEQFPLSTQRLHELSNESLEVLVNSLAADLDLPAMRKLQLLSRTVPDRGRELLSILGGRKRVLEKLRPFRHLASNPALN